MGKKRQSKSASQLREVNFYCAECRHKFKAGIDRVRAEEASELEHHPYRYFSECPGCGDEVPQAAWERNLMLAAANQTGPRTAEGKAKVADNLAGHPTPEETQITRFNAMKHGLFARTATYYPAKPGQYPHCDGCEYRYNVCREQIACLKRTELFMKHHIAFESQDPNMLRGLRSDLQSNIQAIIDDIILAIISEGVQLKTPAWYYDKDGGFHLAEYSNSDGEKRFIYEINAHPLLKILSEFISRNNMTLGDMAMTPKVQENNDIARGYLDNQAGERETETEYRQLMLQNQHQLKTLIESSYEKKSAPAVIDAEVVRDEDKADG